MSDITGDCGAVCNYFPERPSVGATMDALQQLVDAGGKFGVLRHSDLHDVLRYCDIDGFAEQIYGYGDGHEGYQITEAGRTSLLHRQSVRTKLRRQIGAENYHEGL